MAVKRTSTPKRPATKNAKKPAAPGLRTSTKTVVGWSERIDFPDWGISGLRAKVDTGARTSALHVDDLSILPDGTAHFCVVTERKPRAGHWVAAPIAKWARVRSSNGALETRCFVRTRMRLGNVEKEIEVSLVSRDSMRFRMLLGRTALQRDFLVDVTKKHSASRTREATAKRKKVP